MMLSAIIVFWGLGFEDRPRRLGIAIIITVAFIVAMAMFNGWLYRRSMAQADRLAASSPISPIS